MGSSCIKTGDDLSVFIFSYWKLCFISVMIRIIHSHDRFHLNVMKTTDPFQMATNLLFFKFQLFLIRQCLKLTSSALTCNRTCRLHTIRRWRDDLHQTAISIILFCLDDLCFYPVSDHGVFHKNGEAIGFTDTFTVNSAILYIKSQYIIFTEFH